MQSRPDAGVRRATDDRIFADLYPELRRFAAVVGSSDIDPDDLVQEALALALCRGPLTMLDHPGAYLRRTILNLERSHRRRWARWRERQHRLPIGDDVVAEYPSDLVILQHVRAEDRALLYLSLVEGLSYRAIGEQLGLPDSESALRGRAGRALRRLRDILDEEAKHER